MTQQPQEIERDLNQMILSGKALDAFEQFYSSDVVMQENDDEPRVGKEANRSYEEQFFQLVDQVHNMRCDAQAASGDTSFSEWTMDLSLKDGTRVKRTQIAKRTWRDGRVVHEHFFYRD